ncbi:MAG: hypothetical protein Kow0037_24840 [Calditrichia bacterium]
MNIVVDSNVLLSIFSEDSLFEKSKTLLLKYHTDNLVINDFLFLELRYFFSSDAELLEKLELLEVDYVRPYLPNSNFIIPAWKAYLKKRRYFCPECKRETTPVCLHCGKSLAYRQRILTDFFVADFALQQGGYLLTHDRGFYRNYFSGIQLLD